MSSEPFGDIPLFRELQRILAAGEGPVNFEIARQVANAIVGQVPETSAETHVFGTFAETVRSSELVLSGYTRLTLDEPVLARTITRSVWVASTLEGWRWLLEHLSQRMSDQVTQFAEGAGAEVNPMGAVMGQIAPLLLGIQAGTLVGHLAQESLGRYDPLIPRNDDGRLFFIVSNVEKVSSEYLLDPEGLRRWLALQDVARHLVLVGVEWVTRYFRSLFFELLDSIEIDPGELQNRLAELQTSDPAALEEGLAIDQVIPIVPTERHSQALSRLRAFVACIEGYAKHASSVVAGEIVGDYKKIEEGVTRHTNAASPGKSMLSQILGVTFDRPLEAAGATFCAAIVKLHGIQALNRVWEAPDNLPGLEEIKDPFAWIERVLEA
jgi:putative hydrolase